MMCSCQGVAYCCTAHQTVHWETHKACCTTLTLSRHLRSEQAILAQFQVFDLNGDGKIDRAELEKVLGGLEPAKWNAASLEALFKKVPVDASGCISYESFVRWVCG